MHLLVDPESDEIFYVGKGKGWRFNDHLEDEVLGNDAISDEEAGAKLARIRTIRQRGQEPRVEFARIQIENESDAYQVEAALIDVLHRHAPGRLTNAVRGHDADLGLISLTELQQERLAPFLDTDLRAILIKLHWWTDEQGAEVPRHGFGYRVGMSNQDLNDSTRAWWRMSVERAKGYPYAVAVYQGVTRGVWEIDHGSWRPSGGRAAFEGKRIESGPAFHVFYGQFGRRVPPTRVGGGAVFGTGAPFAYWP